MKKTLLMVLLALSGLTACGDQKITQQVTIDKSLLEVLQGKGASSGKPDATPSVNPQPSAHPSASPVRNSSGSNANVSADVDTKSLVQVIHDNANALNAQDLNAYANTLHPQSPFFQAMPNLFTALVQAQLRYRINSTKVISQSEGSATVFVERSTTSAVGTSEDNVIYTLRQSGSAWKVFFMELDNGNSDLGSNF